jgi:hypothetical protein
MVGAKPQLDKGNPKAMYPMASNMVNTNNETILHLLEMIIIKGQLRAKSLRGEE